MKASRMYHSIRLLLCRKPYKRAQYLKKNNILGSIGEDCRWGPWLLPLYPKLIRLHNNVHVHKTARIVTHDMLNNFLKTRDPEVDFGHREKIGCVELMDNVYISMNVTVMPDVRINKDCIISAGSVVVSDIPENSIASGVPAKPTGRFDIFVALRKMSQGQRVEFKNQELADAAAEEEWSRFIRRRQ
jgi:acetyltransferase-like isoleucine patch superfamily enzyme